jgi:hypothetical protein
MEDEIRNTGRSWNGMRSGGQVAMATLGSSSWMPHAPQGEKGTDDDDDGDDVKDPEVA